MFPEVAAADIIILAIIFSALVFICLVLAWMNNKDRHMQCQLCGGHEYLDVLPGEGLISSRIVVRCYDCKTIRNVEYEDVTRELV